MKRRISLLLTIVMLLGVMGTAASAAGSDLTVPTVTAKVDSKGNVTVQLSNGYKDATYAYAYVYTADGGSYFVGLTYDSTKEAWTGRNEDVAGGAFQSISLSRSESTKLDEEGRMRRQTSEQYSYYYSGEDDDGKTTLSQAYHMKRDTTYRDVEVEYINYYGEKKKTTTTITAGETRQEAYNYYDSETQRIRETNNYLFTSTGDENGYTETVDRASVNYSNWSGSAYKNRTETTTAETSVFEAIGTSQWGSINFREKTYKEAREELNYNEDGYSGKHVSQSESEYDMTAESNYEAIRKKESGASYNKNNKLQKTSDSVTDTTYNDAGNIKTTSTHTDTTSYDDAGKISGTTKADSTYVYEKNGAGSWEQANYSYNNSSYNREGVLTNIQSAVVDYVKGTRSEMSASYTSSGRANYTRTAFRDSKAGTSSTTERRINTYTGKATYEYTQTGSADEDGNWKYVTTYAYNNDDGTPRRSQRSNADGSVSYFNQDNILVATKDKDGTWTDGTGQLIGENDLADGNGTRTYVSFKNRTGEIRQINIETYITDEDGSSLETDAYYVDGELDRVYAYVNMADGTYEYWRDGKLQNWHKTDESGFTCYYNARNILTSTDDGKGTRTYYEADGTISSIEKGIENGTAYYDGTATLLYTKQEVEADDVYYMVYRDGNGREFARTYNRYDEAAGTTTNVHIYQEPTDDNGWYEGDQYYWNPERASGTLERVVSGTSDDTAGNTTVSTNTADYTKWTVENGVMQPSVATRNETTVSVSGDKKHESRTYTDGVLTQETKEQYNADGSTIKSVSRYYDAYTGKQTSAYKSIRSGVDDDPVSYSKNYDQYDNLKTYTVRDNTDDWNTEVGYYADGSLRNVYWYDGLDGDSEFNVSYYLNGNMAYQYKREYDASYTVSFHEDGSYSSYSETADDVTNTWNYDRNGVFTGLTVDEKNEDNRYSYEQLDADGSLLYSYASEWVDDKYYQTWKDAGGNVLQYSGGETTLYLAGGNFDGWQNAVDSWFWLEGGVPVKNAWRQIGGNWYFFNYQGRMTTSLKSETKDGVTTVYALDKNGVLGTGGWTDLGNGRWAYTDAAGRVLTGWQQIGGNWYYFTDGWNFYKTEYKQDAHWSQSTSRGIMVTGPTKIWNSDYTAQHTYFFNEDGTLDTTPGWKQTNGYNMAPEYHYYDANGHEVTGWQQIGGNWYYFNEDGVMRNSWVTTGGATYYMDPATGTMKTGWINEIYEKEWYYLDAGGVMQTGWQLIDGVWYYFDPADGHMAADEWITSGANTYYMNANGAIATGWVKDGAEWYKTDDTTGVLQTGWVTDGANYYYMDPTTGAMQTGWVQSGSNWYYLDANGRMQTGTVIIEGKENHFNEFGAWIGAD